MNVAKGEASMSIAPAASSGVPMRLSGIIISAAAAATASPPGMPSFTCAPRRRAPVTGRRLSQNVRTPGRRPRAHARAARPPNAARRKTHHKQLRAAAVPLGQLHPVRRKRRKHHKRRKHRKRFKRCKARKRTG